MNHQEVEQMLKSKTQWANCNLAHMEVSDEGVQGPCATVPRRTEVKELCLGHNSITHGHKWIDHGLCIVCHLVTCPIWNAPTWIMQVRHVVLQAEGTRGTERAFPDPIV